MKKIKQGRPRLKAGEATDNITVRLPNSLRRKAEKAARAENISLSAWIRDCVRANVA